MFLSYTTTKECGVLLSKTVFSATVKAFDIKTHIDEVKLP